MSGNIPQKLFLSDSKSLLIHDLNHIDIQLEALCTHECDKLSELPEFCNDCAPLRQAQLYRIDLKPVTLSTAWITIRAPNEEF
ncbi:hypothetical protein J6590_057964 [Homalodisca vitripennis]|nr:hypothetical protein J6590_057964 [Homalodisca vitripennis]